MVVNTHAGVQVESADEVNKDTFVGDGSSIVDGLDMDAWVASTNDPQASTPPASQQPETGNGVDMHRSPGDVRHDEPVIRGFDMENGA